MAGLIAAVVTDHVLRGGEGSQLSVFAAQILCSTAAFAVLLKVSALIERWWDRQATAPPQSQSPQPLWPTDPYHPHYDPPAEVREPKSRRPDGRSSAAAVPEPDDDQEPIDATARRVLTLRQ
jgi:hypothetical protein